MMLMLRKTMKKQQDDQNSTGSRLAGVFVHPKNMRPLHIGTLFHGPIFPAEMELSEDYTRVIAHGPIPRITHIFGDYILGQKHGFSTEFLKNCYACQKELDGEDIHMYRGEMAFYSNISREKEIEVDEATGKYNDDEERNNGEEIDEIISETSDY